MRYGARDPLLAGWFRAAAYLVWRAVFALIRPTVFALLVLSALVLSYQGLQIRHGQSAWFETTSMSDQFEAALYRQARAYEQSPEALWRALMSQSLDMTRTGAPDLALVDSAARSLVAMVGRDRLGLALLSEERRPDLVEARLRALPSWRRDALLTEAIAARLAEGRAMGLQPAELVLAPRSLQQRRARAQRLYATAFDQADAWFASPGGRALALEGLPGVLQPDVRPSPLFGDVRELVVQGCALAQAQQVRVGQCQVGFLPKPAADPVRASLALAGYGANSPADGARLALAAWAAGRLDRDYAVSVTLGTDVELGREALLAALMPLLAEAGAVYTQPQLYRAAAERAAREFDQTVSVNPQGRQILFEALAELRRQDGAVTALRVVDGVRSQAQARQLKTLASVSHGRLLTLRTLAGPTYLSQFTPDRSETNPAGEARLMLALALLGMAFGLVIWVVISGLRRRAGGPPGGFERMDARMSRLILGRNV